jgi:hypothetical protein
MKRLILTVAVLFSTLTLRAQTEPPIPGSTEAHKNHSKHHNKQKSQHSHHHHHQQ